MTCFEQLLISYVDVSFTGNMPELFFRNVYAYVFVMSSIYEVMMA